MSLNHREPDPRQEAKDLEHLRLLAIGYYVLSGLSALCALFPIFHLVFGIAMVAGQFPGPAPQNQQANGPPPPQFVGWFFIGVAATIIVLGQLYAIALLIAGRMIRRQRRYIFCLVMAGFACLQQPLGIVLGVFSFLVLTRQSVKDLFERNARPLPEARVWDEYDEHDDYKREEWN